MKSVFLLLHERQKDLDNEDIKTIGIYSTKENAEKTIEKYKKKIYQVSKIILMVLILLNMN